MSILDKSKSKPSLAFLSQIKIPQQSSSTSQKDLKSMSDAMRDWELNFALPVVCLDKQEDTYQLLTGLPIYEAAKAANLDKMWVFLIAKNRTEAQKATIHASFQSKLNEDIISDDIVEQFIIFLDTAKIGELTQLKGIKDGYAHLIVGKRPYKISGDLKKLGKKRPISWLKAYREWSE